VSRDTIQTVSQLYAALRTIIPNLPERWVESVTIQCGPCDELPTVTLRMVVLGPDGEPEVEAGDGVGRAETVDDQIVHKVKGDFKRETRRFKIVPDYLESAIACGEVERP
jgi:hypothetical protein